MSIYDWKASCRDKKVIWNTQAGLADKLRASISVVLSWEQEKSLLGHKDLVSFCCMHNVSFDYLLGLTHIERPEDFTREELAQIREFEELLMWRRKNKAKK